MNNILNELREEKKFFGLNARETEIFMDLTKNKNLSEPDFKSILELKDRVNLFSNSCKLTQVFDE